MSLFSIISQTTSLTSSRCPGELAGEGGGYTFRWIPDAVMHIYIYIYICTQSCIHYHKYIMQHNAPYVAILQSNALCVAILHVRISQCARLYAYMSTHCTYIATECNIALYATILRSNVARLVQRDAHKVSPSIYICIHICVCIYIYIYTSNIILSLMSVVSALGLTAHARGNLCMSWLWTEHLSCS